MLSFSECKDDDTMQQQQQQQQQPAAGRAVDLQMINQQPSPGLPSTNVI